jgi:glycosyltransferase involved in cell wall biosynthesis
MREYQFARHLAAKHQLTLAFVTDNPDAGGPISALRSDFGDLEFATVARGWKSLSSAVQLATGKSCTLSYFRSEALRTRLADRLRSTRYDAILVSSSSMIQYALDIGSGVPLVVDFDEVDSEWWLRQAARGGVGASRFFRTEGLRLRSVEMAAARLSSRCVVGTPAALEIVRSLAPDAPTMVISSGIDVGMFEAVLRPGKWPTVLVGQSIESPGDLDEVFGVWRQVAPAVEARVPGVRFVVAVRGAGAARWAGRRGVHAGRPNVTTEDARFLVHDQTVAVALASPGFELRASVLEPMAWGVPVVTTARVRDDLGAAEGIELCTAKDEAGIAEQLVRLLGIASVRRRMGDEGRRFVRTRSSWQVSAAKLDEVLCAAVRGKASPIQGTPSGTIAVSMGG